MGRGGGGLTTIVVNAALVRMSLTDALLLTVNVSGGGARRVMEQKVSQD